MFKFKNVTKQFSKKMILDDVSFEFSGNKLAFVGLNGVGKTTTMNLILGIDKKYKGEIETQDLKASVAFSKNALPEFLSIREFVSSRKLDSSKLDELCNRLNVAEYLDTQIRKLSFGTQMKMNLIFALLFDSEVVFLDEPTNGLDYETVYNLTQIIKEDDRKYFIISHDINFIEETCDHLMVLDDCKIKYDQEIAEGDDVKSILNKFVEKDNAPVVENGEENENNS